MSNVVVQLPFQEACYRLNEEELFVGQEEAILFVPLGEEATLPIKLRTLSPDLTKLSADRIWERGEDEETQLSLLRLAERLGAPYQANKVKSRLLNQTDYAPKPPPFSSMRGVLTKGIEQFLQKGKGVLEIGCGNGVFLTRLLERGENALGLEISNRCLKKSAFRLREAEFTPTESFLVKADGVAFLRWVIPANYLKAIYLLFPDPWDGNIQRRMVTPPFLELVRERLTIGGILFMATDHRGYASQIRQSIERTEGLKEIEWRKPLNTKYHEKWQREGRKTYRFAVKVTKHYGLELEEGDKAETTLEYKLNEGILSFKVPEILVLPGGYHFVIEKAYTRNGDTLLRTVLNPPVGMAHKQFLIAKENRIFLLPTWHEVSIPPLHQAVESLLKMRKPLL